MAKRISKADRVKAEKAAHAAEMVTRHFRTARYWLREARRCRSTGNAEGVELSLINARLDREIAKSWRAA